MNKTGKVVRWEADRGFGFISGEGGSQDVFFHVRDYRGAGAPTVGQWVSYEAIHVGGKGPRAVAVAPMPQHDRVGRRPDGIAMRAARPAETGARRAPRRPAPSPARRDPWLMPVLVVATVWAAALFWAGSSGRLPSWVLPAWGGLNLWTFAVYWRDKRAAQKGLWRVPEDTLHLWSLLGGWPMARVAQQTLRHKSSKLGFQRMYWLTVVLHIGAVVSMVFVVAQRAA
jgi:uncharacterized membrane protein YsdA (DUF1294 family)/cold shock CspA family protein